MEGSEAKVSNDHAAGAMPPGHSPNRNLWLILSGVAVLVAIAVWNWFGHAGKDQGNRKNQAMVVNVARAVRGDMPVTLDEIGTVTPTATVTVLPNASVSGYLISVNYHEGQWVNKGQVLAQIDPRPYQALRAQAVAALAKDQATLAQARYDFSLYEQLNAKKAIAVQTYTDQKYAIQQAVAAVQADKANIAQYDLDITYCRITAPISGQAGLRLVDVGNYITGSSSTGIVVLTTTRPMLVQFGVAQNDIGRLAQRFNTPGVKLPVVAYDSSTRQTLANGTLYAISNQMNTATGQTPMRATFANDNGALWPNAFVDVRIQVDTLHNVVLIPTPSVLTGAPGTYVYRVNPDNTVAVTKVTAGPSDGMHTVITSGLNAGDTVVTDGTDRLNDGATIRLPPHNGAHGAGEQAGAGGHHHHHQQ